MAIALTLGLIAWIERPDSYGFDDLALLVVRQIGLGLARRRRARRASRPGCSRASPTRSARSRRSRRSPPPRSSFGAADVDRRQRLPRRLPRRPRGRQHAVALPPPARRLPRRARVPRPGRAVHRARPARLPAPTCRTSRSPGSRWRCCSMLVVRPAAVWASTAFSDFTPRERLLLGWAGLRGAVPIVLATFVLSSDVPHANTIFNAVFFVVVVSTIVQGTTLEWVAGRLGLLSPAPRGARAAARGRRAQQARPRRLRRRARPRDRRLRGARARPAAERDRRGRRPRRRLDPAARQHGHPARRPPLRARTAVAPQDVEDVFARWRRRI